MASCRYRRACAFFRNDMEYMPGTSGLYRQRYCHKDSASCARYAIYKALGPEVVPPDLFPYQHNRVETVLAEHTSDVST